MITVFDTYEEAHPTLVGFLNRNNSVRKEIGHKYDAATKDYKEKTGINARVRKTIEEAEASGTPIESAHLLYDTHLGKDELADFKGKYPNIAAGLELTSAIELMVQDCYFFRAGIIRPDEGETPSEAYENLIDLVTGVKGYLETRSVRFHGATITPFFYTVNEDLSFEYGEEEREGLTEFLLEVTEDVNEEEINAEMDKPFQLLSTEEIAEFTRLYQA